MARRLTVHVGLEKTGTTYLQHGVAALRPVLREQGIDYPGRAHAHHGPIRDLLGVRSHLCDDALLAEAARGTWADLRAQLAAHRGDAVLSCELLSWATTADAGRVLAALPADEVRIVVTVRSLRRSLPSLWQEQVRHGETRDPHAWLDESVRPAIDGAASPGRLFRADPVAVIDRWRTAGAPEIVVVATDDEGPAFLGRFLEACRLPPELVAAIPDADRPRHPSEDRLRTELVRRVVAGAPRTRDCAFLATVLRPLLRVATRRLPVDTGASTLCAEHEAWARSRDAALAALDIAPRPVESVADALPSADRASVDDPTGDVGGWCRGEYDGGPLGVAGFERIADRAVVAARAASWIWAAGRRIPGVDEVLRTALRSRRYRITTGSAG